jgi:hypothetical protein
LPCWLQPRKNHPAVAIEVAHCSDAKAVSQLSLWLPCWLQPSKNHPAVAIEAAHCSDAKAVSQLSI